MARTDNLTNYLTDVASAIKTKKGSNAPIQASEFDTEIASLLSGGGEVTLPEVNEKDINFYDYDGKRLYAYTLEEFADVTELPPLPSHDGLICQEWNWDLDDIKAEQKPTDVGAIYTTDDGATRIYIEVNDFNKDLYLHFKQSIGSSFQVDWGDGSEPEIPEEETVDIFHSYPEAGFYKISIFQINQNALLNFRTFTKAQTFSIILTRNIDGFDVANMLNDKVYLSTIKKIEVGKGVQKIIGNAFNGCYGLKSLTLPNTINEISNSTFNYCLSLKTFILPKNVNTTSFTAQLQGINRVILSKISSLGTSVFSLDSALLNITLPNDLTEIKSTTFNSCGSLSNIIIPKSVTQIGSSALASCWGLSKYDFSNCTSIPSIQSNSINASCLNIANGKIVVPDNLYDDWIVATNWVALAEYIVKASEYTQ